MHNYTKGTEPLDEFRTKVRAAIGCREAWPEVEAHYKSEPFQNYLRSVLKLTGPTHGDGNTEYWNTIIQMHSYYTMCTIMVPTALTGSERMLENLGGLLSMLNAMSMQAESIDATIINHR